MIEAVHITVRRLPVEEDQPPVCDVLADGQPVGVSVGGAVLEAAVMNDRFIVLFMTDDVPHEEGLTIHLLRRGSHEYVESVALAWPYATGVFRDLTVMDNDSLNFRFFGEDRIVLLVRPKRRLRPPFMPEFAGVFRPFGFLRHMRLWKLTAVPAAC